MNLEIAATCTECVPKMFFARITSHGAKIVFMLITFAQLEDCWQRKHTHTHRRTNTDTHQTICSNSDTSAPPCCYHWKGRRAE